MTPKINSVNHKEIIPLCARTLRLNDHRLVDHGERVAFLADRILKQLPSDFNIDWEKLILLCLFHDIGAYKTEEIDRMVEFETKNVQTHSIYGYLFLKYFSPIGSAAEAILYHHTDHYRFAEINTEMKDYAELIHLADRADIAFSAGMSSKEMLALVQTPKFNPKLVYALEKAITKENLVLKLKNGDAAKWVSKQVGIMEIRPEQAIKYLETLVYSIDFKSEFTVLHSVNTTVISQYLSSIAGFNKTEIEQIYFASLIHDIGKIAIPEEILESPEKLNDEQMYIMRSHVEYTEQIISSILPKEITDIAVRHHEKLDGSGYPHGLTADQLTDSDRIVAVADIISALSSPRSYKEKYSDKKVQGIICNMADKGLIDKRFVNLAIDNFEEMQTVMREKTAPIENIYKTIKREFRDLSIK